LGYPFGQKGWKEFHLETQDFFVSRDVIFHERIFPYAISSTSTPYSYTPHPTSMLPFDDTALVPSYPSDQQIGPSPDDIPV